VTKLVST